MSVDITFSPEAETACLTIPWLFLGIYLIIWGWRLRRRASARLPRPSRKNDYQWWGRLVQWGAIGHNNAGWVVLQEFTRSYDLLLSSVLLGLGLLDLLLFVGGGVIALTTTGTLVGLTVLDSGSLSNLIYLILLPGFSLGLADGFRRLRNATTGSVTYGDLHPRRLADYRSLAFRWLMLALIALVIVETIVLAPHIGPTVSFNLGHWMVLTPPTSLWVLGILPAAMIVLLVGSEIVMVYIARLPRLLVTSDPQTAQRADNFLRALIIGLVQCFQLSAIGYLGVNQDTILADGLWQQHFWRIGSQPYGSLSSATYLLAWAVIMLGMMLPSFAGRIGGRIGGWPWRPKRVTP